MEWVSGGLLITTGLIAAAVGVLVAHQRLHQATRIHRRTLSLSLAPEGWNSWFLVGFSSVSMGIQWLVAMTAWLAWTLAGMGFIALGLTVFDRLSSTP